MNRLVIIGVIILVIVLIAGGFFFFLVFQQQPNGGLGPPTTIGNGGTVPPPTPPGSSTPSPPDPSPPNGGSDTAFPAPPPPPTDGTDVVAQAPPPPPTDGTDVVAQAPPEVVFPAPTTNGVGKDTPIIIPETPAPPREESADAVDRAVEFSRGIGGGVAASLVDPPAEVAVSSQPQILIGQPPESAVQFAELGGFTLGEKFIPIRANNNSLLPRIRQI